MDLIDVHAHLESDRIKDIESVLKRASDKGVKIIIQSGVNPTTNRETLELSTKYPKIIKCSFGLYPLDVIAKYLDDAKDDDMRYVEKFDIDEELAWIREHKDSCVAIGEVGLDYKVIEPTKKIQDLQETAFRKIIKFADKINKPLIIHSRKAEQRAIEVLEDEKFNNVIMHCFSGKKRLIKRGVENGYFFSIPPVIARLQHFETLVGIVPLTQLLTETDTPYLPPVAGEINEPKNVGVTIKKIAQIKGISEKEVAEQIWKNATKIFRLDN